MAADERTKPQVTGIRSFAYRVSVVLLFGCLIVQIYLAGQAATVDGAMWQAHMDFVHIFSPLVLIVPVLAWVVRRTRLEKALATSLPVLMFLQGASVHARDLAIAATWFPGFHAVGAMTLTLVTLCLAVMSLRTPD